MWIAFLGLSALAAEPQGRTLASGPTTAFEMTYQDGAGKRHKVCFALSSDAIRADLARGHAIPLDDAYKAVARDLRTWAEGQKGPELTIQVTDQGLQLGATGRDKGRVKAFLEKAEVERDAALERWLKARDLIRIREGEVAYDYAAIAAEDAVHVKAIVEALDRPDDTEASFTARALAFVQSIPYEAELKRGGDAGFRRPLALLSRNRGDCDGKTVLFLALLEARYPNLGKAAVTVPGHAFAAVQLRVDRGDASLPINGQEWLAMEPVGPAIEPPGVWSKVSKKHRKRADVLVVR